MWDYTVLSVRYDFISVGKFPENNMMEGTILF